MKCLKSSTASHISQDVSPLQNLSYNFRFFVLHLHNSFEVWLLLYTSSCPFIFCLHFLHILKLDFSFIYLFHSFLSTSLIFCLIPSFVSFLTPTLSTFAAVNHSINLSPAYFVPITSSPTLLTKSYLKYFHCPVLILFLINNRYFYFPSKCYLFPAHMLVCPKSSCTPYSLSSANNLYMSLLQSLRSPRMKFMAMLYFSISLYIEHSRTILFQLH